MALPQDNKYSETHEWVKAVDRKDPKAKGGKKVIAVVGITDYAVSRLSDLVHVELPKVGDKVEQGAAFGEIESVKTVAELIAPVGGKISEVNTEAVKHIDLIMEEPFEEGWLVKIECDDPADLESLMSAKDYEEFIKASEEEERGGDDGKDDDVDEGFFM
jgi:glycine cleavage system H protein